jgi:DHA2 family multidrug resistance protein-like MFS transporter
VSETAYEIGAVLGTAVLGSVLAAVYRSGVVVPEGTGPRLATAAHETLGGATTAAARLGGIDGSLLLDSARTAFTGGVQLTALVGAVLLVAVALTVRTGLRA